MFPGKVGFGLVDSELWMFTKGAEKGVEMNVHSLCHLVVYLASWRLS